MQKIYILIKPFSDPGEKMLLLENKYTLLPGYKKSLYKLML